MKIHTVGGYSEVTKNMTAVDLGDDVIILDDGLFLPAIVAAKERERNPTEDSMRSIGALPNDPYLDKKNLREKVRAMLISHAHLDHVGALPYNSSRYNAPIVGTPFTMEVLNALLEDRPMKNKRVTVQPDNFFMIQGKKRKYKAEFVNMTHSTIQTAAIAIHTPEGIVLYVNDYKLDNSPTFGKKPNYQRLKELSKIGIKVLIVNCLYAHADVKTPSERIAKTLLEDVFFQIDNSHNGMVATTFSSHIARLKTITEYGRKLGREVVLLGRSLNKYVSAASRVGKAPFKNKVKIYTYRRQLESSLKKINKRKQDYLILCTGHQGEPGSILDRMSRNKLQYKLTQEDNIIFSSKTIPTPLSEENREKLGKRLRKHHVRVFDNVHVSGHGGREDLREIIKLTNPENIIPTHGDLKKIQAGVDLAKEMGYKLNQNVFLPADGKCIKL